MPEDSHPPPDPDAIASAVLSRFTALPANCKPRPPSDPNAPKEWVPLAGIVLEDTSSQPSSYRCLTLATGMKCATAAQLGSAKGHILHDSHAEILCIRALNRLLLEDALLPRPTLLVPGTHRAWRLRPAARLHLYASTAPCGDASMELVMARQVDATPWPPPVSPELLLGRGNFGLLGVVRRKPARPDAPLAHSKSCSDKLALAQCVGLLGGVAAGCVERVPLASLVLPRGEISAVAMERAFGPAGRMRELVGRVHGGYAFCPFEVLGTDLGYEFARPEGSAKGSEKAVVVFGRTVEVLINGVLQGRKQTDVKGASSVSRRKMWELATKVAEQSGAPTVGASTYAELKDGTPQQKRRMAKAKILEIAFKGWTPSELDRDWTL